MPKISLVVCLRGERAFLARLLEHAEGCYDDLVVVHDGPQECENYQSTRDASGEKETDWRSPEDLSLAAPDAPTKAIARDYAQLPAGSPLPTGYRFIGGPKVPGSIHELVDCYGGRFYEGPRCFQQEPHWPFAWWAAKNDWILRLDADEIPSTDLEIWLRNFCNEPLPQNHIAGFSCIWPLWNGRRAATGHWPTGRFFLFNKNRVSFFGLVEQVPIPEGDIIEIGLVLRHEPTRKSYGIRNILFRRQAYFWRRLIADSLLRTPLDLPRWRWSDPDWPAGWKKLIDAAPLEGIYRFVKFPVEQGINMHRAGERILVSDCLNPAIHHLLLAWNIWRMQSFRINTRMLYRAFWKLISAFLPKRATRDKSLSS